jgi:hypothetical protein
MGKPLHQRNLTKFMASPILVIVHDSNIRLAQWFRAPALHTSVSCKAERGDNLGNMDKTRFKNEQR